MNTFFLRKNERECERVRFSVKKRECERVQFLVNIPDTAYNIGLNIQVKGRNDRYGK